MLAMPPVNIISTPAGGIATPSNLPLTQPKVKRHNIAKQQEAWNLVVVTASSIGTNVHSGVPPNTTKEQNMTNPLRIAIECTLFVCLSVDRTLPSANELR
eukprot:TRINITY_DN113761_c0_g1_i1.p2 TRINITY_DN113761_c0_g1~~TRINITY_DN113761_c0_g1_i1.p2  ORF type:complete len:100 (-),score=7.14 TRINITY_DN113761_c0_g1_i1:349-648(-)